MRGNETPRRIVTNFCTGVGGPRRNHLCQLLWLSLMGFERGGGSNFGFLHWLALSPLQHSRTTVRVCDLQITADIGKWWLKMWKCEYASFYIWHSLAHTLLTFGKYIISYSWYPWFGYVALPCVAQNLMPQSNNHSNLFWKSEDDRRQSFSVTLLTNRQTQTKTIPHHDEIRKIINT